MKKLLLGFVIVSAFLLSACGGDNGELEGTFRSKPTESGLYAGSTTDLVVTYDDKKDEYIVRFISHKMTSTTKFPPNEISVNYVKRNGDWLGNENEEKGKEKRFIKIISKDILQLRDNENKQYYRLK